MRGLPWLLVVLAIITGCNSNHDSVLPPNGAGNSEAYMEAAPATSAEPEKAEAPAMPDATGPAINRQLIYNAELDLKVVGLVEATERVDSLIRVGGGWIQNATQTRANQEWRQEMTIRVQPAKLTGLLRSLAGLGTVERKSLTSADVTAEHADVTARLRTKRALEQRYLELLRQAHKISDVLEIEAKIGGVREDIEAVESRLRVLNDQVAYSTVTLRLYQPLPLAAPDAPVISFGNRFLEALYGGWELTADLVVGVIYLWPIWLLVGAGVAGWRAWRRRRAA